MAGRGPFYPGHPNYHKGKLDKVNPIDFMNNYNLYTCGFINMNQFAKNLGVTPPTLNKYAEEWLMRALKLIEEGKAVYVYPDKKDGNNE